MPDRRAGEVVAPTRDDPFVAASSPLVGGTFGRHARMHPSWTPLRVLLVLVTLTGLLWLVRSAPCSDGGAWFGDDPFSDLCYSDLPLRYLDEGHAERTLPYTDTQGRYPETSDTPPVALAAWGASVVTQALSGWPDAAARGDLSQAQLSASPSVQLEATTYFFVVVLLLFGCTWRPPSCWRWGPAEDPGTRRPSPSRLRSSWPEPSAGTCWRFSSRWRAGWRGSAGDRLPPAC